MSEVRQRNLSYATNQEYEPPSKKLTSDADILIKQLSDKQLKTSTSLKEQLANEKEFIKSTKLTPLSDYNPGTTSLQCFQETTEHFHSIEILKSIGLTDEEICMYRDSLKGKEVLFMKHKNLKCEVLMETLKRIEDAINAYKEKESDFSLNFSQELKKHDVVEYGLSMKPNSIETKLLKFALSNEKHKNVSYFPSPMDNIKEIEQARFSYLDELPTPNISKIRRKARKLWNRINKISNSKCGTVHNYNNPESNTSKKASKWDVTVTDNQENKSNVIENKVYTCRLENLYTIKDREIVKLQKKCEDKPSTLISSKRLTLEEIKKLPKFYTYEPGTPSKVLYVKNLINSIKEDDLKCLFKEFDQHGTLTYKIMNGRMRGQAFVSFLDEDTANQALLKVNGTYIGNKPVIIQFGNRNAQ